MIFPGAKITYKRRHLEHACGQTAFGSGYTTFYVFLVVQVVGAVKNWMQTQVGQRREFWLLFWDVVLLVLDGIPGFVRIRNGAVREEGLQWVG